MEPFLAYVLATTAGVRPLLTLAMFSLAVHFHFLHVAHALAWVALVPAMISFCVLAAGELFFDKVPFLVHLIHIAQIVVKPAVAVVLVGGTMHNVSQQVLIAACIVGALDALGIHIAIASMRGVVTAGTAGAGNPFVSFVEDIVAAGSVILGIVAPIAAACVALAFTIAIVWLAWLTYKAFKKRRRVAA